MIIAEVCLNVALNSVNREYSYRVPEQFKFLSAGWRVIVPFAHRKIDGFVLNISEVDDLTKFSYTIKEISEIVDEEAWFTPEMLNIAQWLSEFYLCPLSTAMGLFMPSRHVKKFSPRFERVLSLAKSFSPEDFQRAKIQLKLLQLLSERGEITSNEISKSKISSAVVKRLVNAGYIKSEKRRIFRDSYSMIKSLPKTFELTSEQNAAIKSVKNILLEQKFHGFLLHGVTGAGKTQVYIELTKIARSIGRRAIILVPEIALTSQIVSNFRAHFSDVAVIHSRLSIAERGDIFYKIRNGDVGIVIGARSALFTPIENIGLIVIDEEQDSSYKQDKISPRYHARIVAEEFAKLHKAAIIFGSATPSLETFYRAQRGELTLLKMSRRALNNPLPTVECVDMRGELRDGNRSVLSRSLTELLKKTLAEKNQAILLLNRRGWSTVVMCRSCGLVINCPDCGLPMTYHVDGKLRCHYCDIDKTPPKICPTCGSRHIKFLGTGTEKLERALKLILPEAKIIRMDRDSTGGKFGSKKILDIFAAHEADILFGTQMVAKGHDISGVTTVGILSADAALSFANFRASENCFTLITQAAGRAGRSNLPGKVIVQAYNNDSPAIRCGCEQDYEKFYTIELDQREEVFFPPFCRLVKLIFLSKQETKAKDFAKKIRELFRAEISKNSKTRQEIFGPIPAAIANLRGVFRFVLLIKSTELDIVRNFLRAHELHKHDDIIIDFDPLTTD